MSWELQYIFLITGSLLLPEDPRASHKSIDFLSQCKSFFLVSLYIRWLYFSFLLAGDLYLFPLLMPSLPLTFHTLVSTLPFPFFTLFPRRAVFSLSLCPPLFLFDILSFLGAASHAVLVRHIFEPLIFCPRAPSRHSRQLCSFVFTDVLVQRIPASRTPGWNIKRTWSLVLLSEPFAFISLFVSRFVSFYYSPVFLTLFYLLSIFFLLFSPRVVLSRFLNHPSAADHSSRHRFCRGSDFFCYFFLFFSCSLNCKEIKCFLP